MAVKERSGIGRVRDTLRKIVLDQEGFQGGGSATLKQMTDLRVRESHAYYMLGLIGLEEFEEASRRAKYEIAGGGTDIDSVKVRAARVDRRKRAFLGNGAIAWEEPEKEGIGEFDKSGSIWLDNGMEWMGPDDKGRVVSGQGGDLGEKYGFRVATLRDAQMVVNLWPNVISNIGGRIARNVGRTARGEKVTPSSAESVSLISYRIVQLVEARMMLEGGRE